ncbi:MAG: hypothetical protein RBT15_07525 [Gudongella sp.]|jgi:hypothetical protein|nr:hypothetical protein [Gudongella sp.]
MIGNKFIEDLFNYPDEDTSINEMIELLKYNDPSFIDSLNSEDVNLDLCNDDEIEYLIKISSLIDYYFQIHDLEIPNWIRDDRLQFDKPYYHSKRISDFDKLKLQIESPSPFRRRNAYFELYAITRV